MSPKSEWNRLRMCVTLDHDFHAHLAMTGHGRPSVVLLRVQGLDAQGQTDLIRLVYAQCEGPLSEGPQSQRIAKASASGDCRFDSNGTVFALC
jgi:predicted nuclease of predicted toxin-antitoxin system